MISYQHTSQEVALKLRDRLRARNFNVWMDVDNMGTHHIVAQVALYLYSSVIYS